MSALREKILAGTPTIGTFVNLGSPLATEVCALVGFDWLLIDLEHGGGGEESLMPQLLAAAAHDVPAVVRVESATRIRVGRALDLGAGGIMLPRVDTAAEAAAAIRFLHYPPDGDRGVASYNRCRQFGARTTPFADDNDANVGIVQIESASAVDDADAIAAIPGIDVLFIGPGDLSHDLGVPGRVDDPAFRDAAASVVSAATRHGASAGILARNPEQAAGYLDAGFTFVAVASDSTFLVDAARAAISGIRSSARPPLAASPMENES
jgi:2-keto-3-deoxy-L-rhamnonate aldolase RhmA